MGIKIEYIKHFSSEITKIAREEMDPQEFYYQEGQETPANKFKYKYQPWHTIPAGVSAGVGIRGLGYINKSIQRGEARKSLSDLKTMARKDPGKFLQQQGKWPGIFTKRKAVKVFRQIGKNKRSAIKKMMTKNKKLAIGVGATAAVAGPGIAFAKKFIEYKKQSMPQYQ